MREVTLKLMRDKACSFQEEPDNPPCGEQFTGNPHQRYCPTCATKHDKRMKRIWDRRTAFRKRQLA